MTDHAKEIDLNDGTYSTSYLLRVAADEIRRLQAENARLQNAIDELRSRFGHLGK